ncbi:MAG: cysteine desulfurase family protein [Acidocella sp.]|nr:cysteine desulfurase family protein [Acidocella sp.]
MRHVYLDFNASTPLAPEVVAAMEPFLGGFYGNPSSHHWAGIPAKEALEKARLQVAGLLGCEADEIVFTSGGTESNNHAIKGVFLARREHGGHVITTQVEHPSVLQPCRFLEAMGATVTYLPVDHTGMVTPQDVRKAITPKTILVSIMHANNEVGTIQPLAEVSRITRDHGILFHTDAAQSVGKIPTRIADLGVDLLSVAGHKVYAPKGVGALYIRRGVRLEPLHHGAGHESGRRAGTENVLLNTGLGTACELAEKWVGMPEVCKLRDYFWKRLCEIFADAVVLNGHPTQRLPNTLNVSFQGRIGTEILSALDGVAASTGSACHAGTTEISPVLRAMGINTDIAIGAIRFSLGRSTTQDEIDYVLEKLSLLR